MDHAFSFTMYLGHSTSRNGLAVLLGKQPEILEKVTFRGSADSKVWVFLASCCFFFFVLPSGSFEQWGTVDIEIKVKRLKSKIHIHLSSHQR